mgnify:CR=1 FL=1
MLLSARKITLLEIVGWLLFFSFLLTAKLFSFGRLETVLLVIGFCIGLCSIYKVAMLSKDDYKKHQREITAWLMRFVIFKVVPLAVAFI